MSGIAFNEAKTLVGNWTQVQSIPKTFFKFTLPCMFPLSFGYTITPIHHIEMDSAEPAIILTSFKMAEISPEAKLEFVLDNPLFLTCIHPLVKDPSSCIPTSISSVPFGNFPSRSTYKKGVLSFRKIATDYLNIVESTNPTLLHELLQHATLTFSLVKSSLPKALTAL